MRKYLNIIIALISVVTMISGIVQVIASGFVLRLVGAEITPTTMHFFAIVGMFMTFFGGLMLQTVYQARPNSAAVLWSALQKLGASLAVFLGIAHGIFSLPAAGVALFDCVSGILFLYYLRSLKGDEVR